MIHPHVFALVFLSRFFSMTPVSTTSALFLSFAFDSASVFLFDFSRSIASRAAGRLFVLVLGMPPFNPALYVMKTWFASRLGI